MKIKNFIPAILLLSAGCAYVPERVEVSYRPPVQVEKIPAATAIAVAVQVVDVRREGKPVGRKKNGKGNETASIYLSNDIIEEVSYALNTELFHRGFSLNEGERLVQVEVQKFYNEFKQGFFGSRGVAELLLAVSVTRSDGTITYSKMIFGIGENDHVWIHSGNNARRGLEGALNDAIKKLFRDKAFLQALTK